MAGVTSTSVLESPASDSTGQFFEALMILTPYRFEESFSPEELQKFGQLALRWSHIEHTIANCLRVLLRFDPKQASVMIYPLSLDTRMSRISEHIKLIPLEADQRALFEELKPLI